MCDFNMAPGTTAKQAEGPPNPNCPECGEEMDLDDQDTAHKHDGKCQVCWNTCPFCGTDTVDDDMGVCTRCHEHAR